MVQFRYARNNRSLRRDADARTLASRIYPRGAAQEGIHKTMANNRWPIVDVNGRFVTLGPDETDVPCIFDHQLKNLRLRKYGTTAEWKILDSDVNQVLELEDVPDGLVAGDYANIRRHGICGPESADLTYLDNPDSRDLVIGVPVTGYGLFEDFIDRPDVPPIDNEVPNAFMTTWSLAPSGFNTPTGWDVANPAFPALITQSTRAEFGPFSMRVQTSAAANVGAETDWIPLLPSAEFPYYSTVVSVYPERGTVRVEVEVALSSGTRVIIPDPNLPLSENEQDGHRSNYTTQLNQWIRFGLGGLNFYDDPNLGTVKEIKIRVQEELDLDPLGAIFYVDAAQITNTPYLPESFYEFRAANQLWHAANRALVSRAYPKLKYTGNPLDLYRAEPATFPYDEMVEGSDGLIHDLQLGIKARVRVKSVEQELSPAQARVTDVEVETTEERLSRFLSQRTARRNFTNVPLKVGSPESTATLGGGLSSLTVERLIDPYSTGDDYERLTWANTDAVETVGTPRFTVDIESTIGGSLATGRDPRLEYTDLNDIPRVGGFEVIVPTGVVGVDTFAVNVYRVIFKDGGTTVRTHETSISGWYVLAS